MVARLRSPTNLATVGLLGLCCLVGLVAGVEPKLALVAAFAFAFALVIFVDFSLGVAIFAGASYLEVLDLGSSATVGKLGGGLVILAWIALVSTETKKSSPASSTTTRGCRLCSGPISPGSCSA